MGNNYTTGAFNFYFYGILVPQNINVNWLGENIRVTWDEFYEPDVQFEIWDTPDGGVKTLLGITALGASSFETTVDNTVGHSISVIATKLMVYSSPSEPIRIDPILFYYVDPAGVDGAGVDGSILNPWLTLAYAATRALVPGDVIHVNAGAYAEPTRINLSAGVSIVGAGKALVTVTSTYVALDNYDGSIRLWSALSNTNGNQVITGITLDGSALTAKKAINVYRRSNVKIFDCDITDFHYSGCTFRSTTYETGNEVYNCDITNCAERVGGIGEGLIEMSYQNGMNIYNNNLDQSARAAGHNGNIIDAVVGHNRALKFYGNTTTKPYSEGAGWNFHIESWDCDGGFEIYLNNFNGGGCHIDIGGYYNVKGDFAYSWYIHHNHFEQAVLQPYNATVSTIGVDIESVTSDVLIEKNYFLNLQFGIYHSIDQSRVQHDIAVNTNIFENIGTTDNLWSGVVMLSETGVAPSMYNIYYQNNTMIASGAFTVAAAFISFLNVGTANDFYIRNNIINGFRNPIWIYSGAGQMQTMYYQNNQLNNTDNTIRYAAGETITTIVTSGNQNGDPLFVGAADFHLQAGSPCINKGINIGLLTDYDNVVISNPPEIGCYEYV